LDVAENGQIALDKLHTPGPLPDLILLDWMMPLVNGEEVLREIKQDSRLKRIPVVVLTTSKSETDVGMAYDLGCNTYLVKPFAPKEFEEMIETLGLYWLETAQLPQ
jgi:DNA-binding response OmpR family regulator